MTATVVRDVSPRPAQPAGARYFVGLDLGQAQDFTALAVLERSRIRYDDPPDRRQPDYQLRHIKRWHLGTSYPDVARDVVALLMKPPLQAACLVIDQTGVGRAVVDLLAEAIRGQVRQARQDHVFTFTPGFCPITITAGHVVNPGKTGGLCVPKKDLVSVMQTLLQTRRLGFAEALPEVRVLMKELENFRVKVSAAAHEVYEAWREGDHDDLVLATALAAWVGEQALLTEARAPIQRARLKSGV
jgi:hypothetical protein